MRRPLTWAIFALLILPLGLPVGMQQVRACCEQMNGGASCPLRKLGGCHGKQSCSMSVPSGTDASIGTEPVTLDRALLAESVTAIAPAVRSASLRETSQRFASLVPAPPDPPPPRA